MRIPIQNRPAAGRETKHLSRLIRYGRVGNTSRVLVWNILARVHYAYEYPV